MLDRVVREVLRLYPPVFFVARKSVREVELGGFLVPKDVVVRVPVLAIQRDAEIWGDNAGEFDPDRFLDKGVVERARLGWCVFMFGPRGCIGQRFAMLEIKAFLAQVLKGVRVFVRTEDGTPFCQSGFATPIGMKVYFERRN